MITKRNFFLHGSYFYQNIYNYKRVNIHLHLDCQSNKYYIYNNMHPLHHCKYIVYSYKTDFVMSNTLILHSIQTVATRPKDL